MREESLSGKDPKKLKAGQALSCKVLSKVSGEKAGYFLTVPTYNAMAYLKTQAVLPVDSEIMVTFVCWTPQRSYMLVTPMFYRDTVENKG